jgi:hypothetical protein
MVGGLWSLVSGRRDGIFQASRAVEPEQGRR